MTDPYQLEPKTNEKELLDVILLIVLSEIRDHVSKHILRELEWVFRTLG
jgi:hypothetical protein